MACYYSQQIIPATPVTTFHLKVLHWMFRPGLQLASQMRLQQAFTDIAIHRTSRGLTTIRHGRWHISQPQSLWIYQLNPNSLFWVPDVCRNHHINIPKRCFPPPPVLLHLAPPVSRQVLGAVVQDSQNLTNKKRRSSWHCSSSQFNKDIPNLHRCSTHFWKMWIWHDVHSYENLSLGKEKKTQHHRHSPPSKNSHLETGGRIEEEQQQSSHIPLA